MNVRQSESTINESSETADPSVNDLMRSIERSVEEKKAAGIYTEEDLALPPSLQTFQITPGSVSSFQMLESLSRVNLEGDPITSHRPVIGSVIKAFKRFTRYWVRKYTDGVFLRQNQFNANIYKTLHSQQQEIDALKKQMEELLEKNRE